MSPLVLERAPVVASSQNYGLLDLRKLTSPSGSSTSDSEDCFSGGGWSVASPTRENWLMDAGSGPEVVEVLRKSSLDEKAGLYDIGAMLDGLEEVTEEQLGYKFDELTAIAADQPDDFFAMSAIRTLVFEAKDRGFVDQALQMAMTLGAMACTHNHLQGLANEIGEIVEDKFGAHDDNDGHTHDKDDSHDSRKCKDCQAGRACRKKH